MPKCGCNQKYHNQRREPPIPEYFTPFNPSRSEPILSCNEKGRGGIKYKHEPNQKSKLLEPKSGEGRIVSKTNGLKL